MHSLAAAVTLPKLNSPPKLGHISIAKVGNGLRVSHKFHNAPQKQFVFHDPAKMVSHIRRAVNQQWLKPSVGRETGRIEKSLNIG